MNPTLRVAALYFQNYYNRCVFIDPENCLKPGITVEVLRDLAQLMNFSIEWVTAEKAKDEGLGPPRLLKFHS